jgi:hypothetical protein
MSKERRFSDWEIGRVHDFGYLVCEVVPAQFQFGSHLAWLRVQDVDGRVAIVAVPRHILDSDYCMDVIDAIYIRLKRKVPKPGIP